MAAKLNGVNVRVLVTGATGLLGSEILRECPESIGLNSKDCNLIDSSHSILTLEDDRIDTVIHCAAKVGGVKANTDYVADFLMTTLG